MSQGPGTGLVETPVAGQLLWRPGRRRRGFNNQSHLHRDATAFTGVTLATVTEEPFLAADNIVRSGHRTLRREPHLSVSRSTGSVLRVFAEGVGRPGSPRAGSSTS